MNQGVEGDFTILQSENARGPFSHSLIVSDHDESLSVGIELIKNFEDVSAGFRIEVSGSLVRENYGWIIGKRTRNGNSLLLSA